MREASHICGCIFVSFDDCASRYGGANIDVLFLFVVESVREMCVLCCVVLCCVVLCCAVLCRAVRVSVCVCVNECGCVRACVRA